MNTMEQNGRGGEKPNGQQQKQQAQRFRWKGKRAKAKNRKQRINSHGTDTQIHVVYRMDYVI